MHFSDSFSFISLIIFLFHCENCHGQKFFSKAKLHPKCKSIEPTNDLDMEWAMTMFAGKVFYVTFGSASAYEDLGHFLSGKRPSKPEDLDDMCVKLIIKAFKATFEGYDGRYMVTDCAMIKKGMQECTANARTEFPNRHKPVKAIQTLAWTDNKENIVLVRCTPDGKKNDWLLYSSNTTIAPETKVSVLNHMKHLGFDQENPKEEVRYPKYDACVFDDDDDL